MRQTFIFRAIKFRNSGKSMVPLPSASTSLIMSCSSASVGFCPRDRITVPSSFVVMVPGNQIDGPHCHILRSNPHMQLCSTLLEQVKTA